MRHEQLSNLLLHQNDNLPLSSAQANPPDVHRDTLAAASSPPVPGFLAGPDLHRQRLPDAHRGHWLEPLPVDRQCARPGPGRAGGVRTAGLVHAAHRARRRSLRPAQGRRAVPDPAGADRAEPGNRQPDRSGQPRDDLHPRVPARRRPLLRNAHHPGAAAIHRAGDVISPRGGRRPVGAATGDHRRAGRRRSAVCIRQCLGLRTDGCAVRHFLPADAQPASTADAVEQGQGHSRLTAGGVFVSSAAARTYSVPSRWICSRSCLAVPPRCCRYSPRTSC